MTANAIALDALKELYRGYVNTMESGRDRIVSLGGQCDTLDMMEASDPWLISARAAIAALEQPEDAAVQAEPLPEQEEEFTQGVNAAVAMLEKIAADHCEKHAWTDPDTGVRELKPGPIEDYYNTVMELADNICSIVYTPGERENTAQTLKAAKDAAFEQAANLLECEYAEDARQSRRLYQIAQHIRDLKKGSL